MAGLIAELFSGGARGMVEGIGGLVDRFVRTEDEKAQFVVEVERIVSERMAMMESSARATVEARMQVIVAELQHGDAYTKRTRPLIARLGLYVVIWNHAAVPTLGGLLKYALVALVGVEAGALVTVTAIDLPVEFWIAWGGITSTYAVGRSFEKFGVHNRAVSAATGQAAPEAIARRVLGHD